MMNKTSSTLDTILSHRSIRKFTPKKISTDILEQLINAARCASTSNNLQCISIIRITDETLREQIMACASNQQYIKDAAEFFVFCVDFHKHQQICPESQLDYTEVLLIGAVDAGIMAQNVLVAAESLGLGGVYIGALRNEIEKVSELLKLPAHSFPVFGLCLGYPAQDPPLKPRLPKTLMCFENTYQALQEPILAEYNQQVQEYYQQRSKIDMDWTRNIEKTLAKPVRPHILPFLQKQGFIKK
ncbi:oxygen-insensitive NADPH nitroreductase [Conservatibacter flavescens]|uniref:Oxygen-insensitive NADPH nitroreductase n=1 Tax=Conservatibacter flavescens TaxID=28161 RepID=A0A2M8S0G0_9PAST|nr:oxygen-insensitive NADPH nitroreductase [Conservatibacter flavescens]PJG84633.1 oxygen-insensitive NADPH nitroreductase [Conservatibacter flavescens]